MYISASVHLFAWMRVCTFAWLCLRTCAILKVRASVCWCVCVCVFVCVCVREREREVEKESVCVRTSAVRIRNIIASRNLCSRVAFHLQVIASVGCDSVNLYLQYSDSQKRFRQLSGG